MTALSIMNLIDPPGKIAGGSIEFVLEFAYHGVEPEPMPGPVPEPEPGPLLK